MWINDFERQFSKHFDTPDEFLTAIGCFSAGAALANRVYIKSPDEVTTNLYVTLCAPPGWYHKSTPIRVAIRMLKTGGVVSVTDFLPSNASSEALGKLIAGCCKGGVGHGVMVYDEMKTFLTHVRKEYAANIGSLVTEKLERGVPVTFARKKDGGVEVDTIPEDFVLSFISSTTTAWLMENIRPSDISGGMLSRFLLIEAHRKSRTHELPAAIDAAAVGRLAKDLIAIRDSFNRTEFLFRQDAARQYSQLYRDLERDALGHGHPEYPALISRAPLYLKKIALLLAALSGKGSNVIHPSDVEAAAELVHRSTRSCAEIVDEAVAVDGTYGRILVRARRILSARRRMAKRDLLRTMHVKVRELDEVCDAFETIGNLTREREGKQEMLVWQETAK